MERGDLVGAILDGRYRVLEPVAEGAMGVVYRAERVKLGRIVAIKVLHDVLPGELSARKRFEIEARAMAQLEHPHCASVLDVGIHDERPFVVMDFVSGPNLKDVISEGPQPPARAVEIVRQVLSGLAHAHEHGIIHRDIKPANLVLSQKTGLGDHVKILDFGLARFARSGQNLTTGIVVGTPAYMAPEQIRGGDIDLRVDLYACGVLLFELLTGEKPFHSIKDDPIEVCRMHLTAPIPRLADKRPGDYGALEHVVELALAKDPDERYMTAQAFVIALDAAIPHRASTPAIPLPTSVSAPLAGAGFAEDDEPLEIRSGDVLSARPATRARTAETISELRKPRLATPVAGVPARTATPVAGVPVRTATPVAGVPTTPAPVRTFLGLPVTPPTTPTPVPSRAPTSHAPPDTAAVLLAPEPPQSPAAARKLPQRWLVVAGGAAIVAGGIVLAIALHGAPASAPRDAGSIAPPTSVAPPADPTRDIIERADQLIVEGNKDAALELLLRERRQFPASAELAFTAGRIYFAKYYWTDGIKSFRDALRLSPAYRSDPELIKTVLRGFLTTPAPNEELASFLRQDIGAAAAPFLEEAAHAHPNPELRRRAAAELRHYK